MKRVGIITMHRVSNYGSVLQAYALQKVISNMGYECEIIDYVYPNSYHNSLYNVKKSWKSYIAKWLNLTPNSRNLRKISYFRKNFIKSSVITYRTKEELQKNPPIYDIYITGSDQVWNPIFIQNDTSFLLSFAPRNAKRISYSSSFACSFLDSKYLDNFTNFLSLYNHISVREKNGAKIIREIIGKEVSITLDPTLLITGEEWNSLCRPRNRRFIQEKYILAYILNYAFNSTPYIYDLINYIYRETQYRLIYIGTVPKELKKIVTPIGNVGPEDYLQLFRDASCIITTSFHGTAFAVNFGIPFYSVVNKGKLQDDRQFSFLQSLGIPNRAIPVGTDFSFISKEWNVKDFQSKLSKMKEESLGYLKNALDA